MRILSDAECEQWLSNVLQEPFGWRAAERLYPFGSTYLLPTDAGRKTALARTMSAFSVGAGEGLLWVTEWGVFPSAENMALFDGYRNFLGETRPLSDAPGHLYDRNEGVQLECLLDLVLYFFWDASLFSGGGIWMRSSHDEVLSIHTRDEESLRTCEDSFAPFGLKQP